MNALIAKVRNTLARQNGLVSELRDGAKVAVAAPPSPKSMKFPAKSLEARELRFVRG
jgi:hypothetical protein